MTKRTTFVFVVGILIVILGVGVSVALRIGLENAFVPALTAALVYVTAFYAHTSWQSVRVAKQSVASSVASVAEMQKQRYIGSQPWVFPQLVSDKGEFVGPAHLLFLNVGNGPAIDLKPFISDGDVTRIRDEWKQRTGPSDSRRTGPNWAALKDGASIPWQRAFEALRSGQAGVIAVEYHDIYGREILSGWAYRIEEVEDKRLVVIPGIPLYPVERKG